MFPNRCTERRMTLLTSNLIISNLVHIVDFSPFLADTNSTSRIALYIKSRCLPLSERPL